MPVLLACRKSEPRCHGNIHLDLKESPVEQASQCVIEQGSLPAASERARYESMKVNPTMPCPRHDALPHREPKPTEPRTEPSTANQNNPCQLPEQCTSN